MLADNIIERDSLYLRNLNTNSYNTAKDVWTPGLTGYGFYGVPYEKKLMKNRKYYFRFTYKYTTSNQSPTWSQFYTQGGSIGGPNITNPVAGTEYTVSGVYSPNVTTPTYTQTSGTLYNGPSTAINGVISYAKNVLTYDVTELCSILQDKAVIDGTNAALKTWCDQNLDFVPRYTNYDIRQIVANIVNDKVTITKGFINSTEFIETDGMEYYTNPYDSYRLRGRCYFDTDVGIYVYNNSGGGTVTHTRIDGLEQESPYYPEHKYILKITTNGTASPGAGGFVAYHNAAANKIFIERFVAKVPTGYTVQAHYNSQGTGSSITYLTSMAGTGKWEEYAILYKCGSSGTFSSGGHVAITGSNNTSVTWYVAYINNCDITSKEYLKNYVALPGKAVFKAGYTFAYKFDTINLLPNGDFHDISGITLPSGYSWDETDVAGSGKRSLVQGINTGGYFALPAGDYIALDACGRYKFSCWIKCKGDMSNFLIAIIYRHADGVNLDHTSVSYVTGTKTTLAADLVSGATTVKVASNANWRSYSYSKLGFRSGSTYASATYNDKGTSNGNGSIGIVSGISGSDTINLAIPYSGSTIPSNTVIVESYDGGTYPYPIGKGNLPTDNTWKYVEGYFGADSAWDGAGGGWAGIPSNTVGLKFYVNLYTNDGTVPIKYCDFRIQKVSPNGFGRVENKIQIEGNQN